MDFLTQLRHVIRRLLRTPTFTAVALLTLAVGIGANTAIFSVVNGVLLKPLPYPEADRLIGVWHTAPGVNLKEINNGPSNYFTYREESRTFVDMGVYGNDQVTVTGVAEPERVAALNVTASTLPILGVAPFLGRTFSAADDSPGRPETIVLTYGYWQRRFGGDQTILGRRLIIDGRAMEVIGVMPQSFRFLAEDPAIILPYQFDRSKIHLANFSHKGVARLKPGATIEQATADVARMLPLVIAKFPPPPGMSAKIFEDARFAPLLRPLKNDVIGDIGSVLWVLMATIGIVLLMACANVANLLLVRAESRQQELAVRAALGAGRGRIAKELLLESVTLGTLGGILGLAVAYGCIKLLKIVGPATLPRLEEVTLEPIVLAFTLVISLAAGVLFGLIPVFKYAGAQLASVLRGGGRTVSQSKDRHRAQNILVVLQFALALVLLVSAGLMIRTFTSLRQVKPGFLIENIQNLTVTIPSAQVKDLEATVRMQQAIQDKIASVPGVTQVAIGTSVPMDTNVSNDPLYAEDRQYSEGQLPAVRRYKSVAPGYFKVLGIAMLAGRDLTWTDLYEKRPVVLISESVARDLWKDPALAIGKRVREQPKGTFREIVGVVADTRDNGIDQPLVSTVFWPLLLNDFWGDKTVVRRTVTYIIRSDRAGTESLIKDLRQAIWSVNANVPLANVQTMDAIYRQSLARTSFALVMLAIAGGMALLLGIVGIYGVLSYAVTQRTREIGIRMALGAQPGELHGLFLKRGLLLAGTGIGCGLIAAAVAMRLMKTLLFETSTLDPMTYIAVALTLVAAALAASYIPARRATNIDPVNALRAD